MLLIIFNQSSGGVVTPLTVTINQAVGQSDPTSISPINFTVIFSDSVSDFITGELTLSGTAGATIATVTGSGTTYNVAVSGMAQAGTVIVSVPAGVAHDGVGTANDASTSTDNTVEFLAGASSPSARGIEYHFPPEKSKLRSKPRPPRVTSIVAYAKIGFRLKARYAFRRRKPVVAPIVQPALFQEAVREPNRYTAGGRLRFGLRLRAESEFIRHVRLRATVDFYSHTEFLRELDEAELLEGVYD